MVFAGVDEGAGWVVECAMPKDNWEDDSIQFSRLLAEINAVGLTDQQYAELMESTELTRGDIDELLQRAEKDWEHTKTSLLMSGRQTERLGGKIQSSEKRNSNRH